MANCIPTTASGGIRDAASATPATDSHSRTKRSDNTATAAENIAIKKSRIFGDTLEAISLFSTCIPSTYVTIYAKNIDRIIE